MARKTRFRNPQNRPKSGGAAESSHQIRAGHPPRAPEPNATSSKEQGSEETYEVGYGRPPLSTCFKPGQSGNPKGRTKQSQNLKTIVKQVSNEQIQIREGNRPRRMSRMEALVRSTFTRAFKDPKALSPLITLLRQCGYGADHDEPAGDVLLGPEYEAIVKDFLADIGAVDTASGDVNTTVAPAAKPTKREG
jgi:hypothetical protein